MAARTSSFRIDDLISAPKHTHALCGGDETQFKPLLPALSQPQAGPSSCTMAMAMSGDTVQRVAQLLAFASQQQSHVLDAAATAPPTPTLPLLFAAQPPSADAFHQYATAHFSPMSQPQPQPHPASLLANEAVANQVSPIPWYIYQQMALRQAFENGVCIPGMSSAFHDSAASYFFAAHQHSRKPKRIRTAFSPSQLLRLEAAFDKNPYVVGQERKELAASLNLSETQVKVWFQNRRTKKKRMKSDDSASQNGDSEQDDNENENGAGSRPQSSLSFSSKDSRSCKSPATSPAQS